MSQQNYVFVLDTNKQPLAPCSPRRARILLNTGKAAVYRRYPFTIILKRSVSRESEMPANGNGYLRNVQIKLDPGSKTTGIAVLADVKDEDGECQGVVWVAELSHRGHRIKEALDSRRIVRRSRRQRKTRYRQPRYLNRSASCRSRIAPSLMSRVLNIETWVKRLIKFAPVVGITQELVRFDMQKMQNPEISGIEYQQGTLQGYEVREYLLEKWDRQCAYCGVQDVPLQIEHIQARANGGSNRVSNLTLACEKCNQKKGIQDIKTFLKKKPEVLAKILKQAKTPLKDAAVVNTTRWVLFERLKTLGLSVSTGSGAQTKFNRIKCGIDKTHWKDAVFVGEVPNTLYWGTQQPLIIQATGFGGRQKCQTNKFGYPIKHRPLRPIFGFSTGDIVRAVVPKGKYQGIFTARVTPMSDGRGEFVIEGKRRSVRLDYCTAVHRRDGYSYPNK